MINITNMVECGDRCFKAGNEVVVELNRDFLSNPIVRYMGIIEDITMDGITICTEEKMIITFPKKLINIIIPKKTTLGNVFFTKSSEEKEELMGKTVFIQTRSGKCFTGILRVFDERTVILDDETSTISVDIPPSIRLQTKHIVTMTRIAHLA